VILPRTAQDWSADRIRVVLAHELAHIKRGDWLINMARLEVAHRAQATGAIRVM